MKKALFAAFAGMCVISSFMTTSASSGKINNNQRVDRIIRDTIPKKTDTSRYPKPDTTSMPKIIDLSMR